MIFQHTHEQVLAGVKTQSRRLCRVNDQLETDPQGNIKAVYRRIRTGRRRIYRVGQDYAIQSGRRHPAVARMRLTKLRRQRLQEITEADARAEGCDGLDPRRGFFDLWDQIHGPGHAASNPIVYVLEFEVDAGTRPHEEEETSVPVNRAVTTPEVEEFVA